MMKRMGMIGGMIGGLGLALLAGGCSLATPPQLEAGRIQVREAPAALSFEREDIAPPVLARIADDYRRNANGAMNVYISYPESLKGAEGEARRLAHDYGLALTNAGVRDLTVAVVPTDDSRYERRVVVSYPQLKAAPPKDCTRIPGRHGGENLYDLREYAMGCEMMHYTSRMVHDPKDLLGRGGAQDSDGRRAGNVVERYRTGEPLEPLETSSASGLGG